MTTMTAAHKRNLLLIALEIFAIAIIVLDLFGAYDIGFGPR